MAAIQIGEDGSTVLKPTKAALQSVAVPLPGVPDMVTSLLTEGTNSDAKLTGPPENVKCAAAG